MDKVIGTQMEAIDSCDSRSVGDELPTERPTNPFVIARVSGVPTSLVTRRSPSRLATSLARENGLQTALQERKEAITGQLEQLLPAFYEAGYGKQLLKLKRDIFNGRSTQLHPELRARLRMPLVELIDRQLALADGLSELSARFEHDYALEVQERRDEMLAVWSNDNLRNGILCSSPALHGQLAKIMVAQGPIPSGKKAANGCDSLMAYAARSALKASPLSSLTMLWPGEWQPDGQRPTGIEIDSMPFRRIVTVKSSSILHALEPIWSDLEILGMSFPLTVNPTVQQMGPKVNWSQIYRSSYHHEKIWGHNPSDITVALQGVAQIIKVFQAAGASALSAGELINALAAAESEPAKRKAFVERLLALQFLVPALERRDQETNMSWLNDALSRMDTDRGARLFAAKEEIDGLAEPFRTASEDERAPILRELNQLVRELATVSGSTLPDKALSPTIFEDCYVDRPALQIDPDSLQTIFDDLHTLLDVAPALDFNHVMQSLIARQFVERFGPDGVCNDAPQFLQDVMDMYFGTESEIDLDRMTRLHHQQMELDVGRGLIEVRKRYHDLLAEAEEIEGVIQIDPAALKQLTQSMPTAIRKRPLSQSFTGHVLDDDQGGNLFVLNQILPGASGLLSRFFAGSTPKMIGQVQDYLRDLAPSGNPIEIPAVFGFNANFHPMLLQEELAIPGIPAGYEATAKVSLRDLTISYCSKADRIVLRHNGQPLDPMYLGFMAPSLLPRRIRALTMTTTQNKILYVSRDLERLRGGGTGDVTVLPRVMIGSICLSRRMHVFPIEQRPDPTQDDRTFFMAVWRWRHEWDLPRQAFWRHLPNYPEESQNGVPMSPQQGREVALSGQSEFDPTAFKPAFIDFDDPLHVRIFRRSLVRNRFDLAIEEALPAPDQHNLSVGEEKHLCELQFELSRKGEQIS